MYLKEPKELPVLFLRRRSIVIFPESLSLTLIIRYQNHPEYLIGCFGAVYRMNSLHSEHSLRSSCEGNAELIIQEKFEDIAVAIFFSEI